MKKTILAAIAMFPLLANAGIQCSIGNVVFYGDIQENKGSQRLCHDPVAGNWYFGVKRTDDKLFSDMRVKLIKNFSYQQKDERVEGYEILADEDTRIILMSNTVDGKIKAGFTVINKAVMPFNPETVVYKEEK